MSEAFRLGGWGMYPTALCGLVLVISAWRFGLGPTRARLQLVTWLGVLTGLVATLGFVTGMIKSVLAAGALAPNEAVGTVLVGLGESANNLGLGLVLGVMATLGVVVGHARRPPTSAELVDPTQR